jgi:hypothetical protein
MIAPASPRAYADVAKGCLEIFVDPSHAVFGEDLPSNIRTSVINRNVTHLFVQPELKPRQ